MRCPHQDQADSVIAAHPTRVRQRFTSSHTLLINLRRRGEHFQGGATRYFMDGTVARAVTILYFISYDLLPI